VSGATNAVELSAVSKRFWIAGEKRTSLKERVVRGKGRAGQPVWALHDASFSVPSGTTFGLVGHNGSGKSTALKVISGIYRPTSGDVTVNGRVSALLELGAGFHPELTGRENIRLNGTILGMSRREIDGAMDRIIDFSGLSEFIDTPVKVYSSGMYVRLGFAIAVNTRPEVLAVDEVIAVGDEEFQRKCMDHLHWLRQQGSTILMVSHALGLVEDLCDRAVWLDHGRVRGLGDARAVVRDYLASVNENERGSSDDGGPASASSVDVDGADRYGSGEVRVVSVTIIDADGHPVNIVVSGQPITVRLHYRAVRDIASAVFGLGFVHESGITVAGPNSASQGPWAVPAGSGQVDFQIGSLALAPGTFMIRTAVVDRGRTFDHADNQATLRVRGSGDDPPGLFRMEGTWDAPSPSPVELDGASDVDGGGEGRRA
jgi:ABC-2 type transport system ATP-binding protein/lipopolysaccharide transport system ATP-binding protein